MKDCLRWERLHVGTGEGHEKKGAAKTSDELAAMTTTCPYCCLKEGGRKVKREVESMKKAG